MAERIEPRTKAECARERGSEKDSIMYVHCMNVHVYGRESDSAHSANTESVVFIYMYV